MQISEAFRETMFRFRLSGKKLAEASGLTPAQISKLKNGGNIRTDSFDNLLNALPPNAKTYLLDLVSNGYSDVQIPYVTGKFVDEEDDLIEENLGGEENSS